MCKFSGDEGMGIHKIRPFVFFLMVFFSAAPLWADEVIVDGFAEILYGRDDFARKAAVENGLSEAISLVTGSYVESSTLVEKGSVVQDAILSRSSGFVEKYEVLSEKKVGSEYHVSLKVQVKNTTLLNALDGLGVLLGRKDYPRISIVPQQPSEANSLVQAELLSLFRQKGFFVTASTTYSDLLLEFNSSFASSEYVHRNIPIHFNELSLSATVTNISTRDIISAASSSDKKQGLNSLGARLVLAKSLSATTADKLIADIMRTWNGELSSSVKLMLIIKGLESYEQFLEVKEFFIHHTAVIEKIIVRDFFSEFGVMEVFSTVSSQDLLQEIGRLDFHGIRLVVEETKQNSATVNLRR